MREPNYWTRLGNGRLNRRRLMGTAAMLGAGIAAAGCNANRGASTKPSSSASSVGKPQPGGQLITRVTTDPFDWDMSYTGKSLPNQEGTSVAYDSLLSFKNGPDVTYDTLMLQPRLAQRWEIPDAQTYIFHLHNNAKFANVAPVNGRALTSSDVKWSFEYASRTGQFKDKKMSVGQFGWFFEGLNTVDTPDMATATVRFQEPFVPFINYSASNFNIIVPHEIYDQYGNFKDHIVGSGPYQIDEAASQKGSRWVWKKNLDYWDAGKPYINQITWLVLTDDASAAAAFQTKQLDLLGGGGGNLGVTQAQQVKKDNPDAVMYSYTNPAPLHLYMNNRVAPLNDTRVRQAISLAMDRDEFIKSIVGGQGAWALAGAFPDTFSQAEIKQILHYDPAKAKQLLSDAGYADGLSMDFIYPGNAYGDVYIQEMQLFQAQLKKVGVNLNLKSLDKGTYSTDKKKGNYVITFTGKDLSGDVDSYLYATFHTGQRDNYAGVSDPKLDAMIEAQRQETDPAKRRTLVRQAVQYINEQAYSLAMFYGPGFQFWQPRLKNYAPHFGVNGWPITNSWLEG